MFNLLKRCNLIRKKYNYKILKDFKRMKIFKEQKKKRKI